MDIEVIKREVKSPALKEIVESLTTLVSRVEGRKISYQQAQVEITGHKHLLQTITLDWAFNRRMASLPRKAKEIE